MAVSALMAGGMGGCQGDLSAQAPEMENVVSDIKAQAAERAANGDASQISAIIQSVMKRPGGAELLERLNGVIGQK